MQAFYVKKEKKLSNDYHKINTGNQSIFYENVKDNEIKDFFNQGFKLIFQGIPDETVKNNQSKACPLSG
ncbi:Uncharacterised protein [Streptococcus pneumoniae]|uniref:hypothetical protein n=1 Tax=Streptococcus pneumoniae TaxID=1313 RepID=UPI0005E723E9|nr:hypothetical protein [Streptococcus pneumoniae]MDG9004790.1 hypothetical protein [Streptococcus pneumoniae]MDG9467811.1 hypothetical protein [Streptococcus pneumoniae]MDS2557201.1 hypothetical protein [Streptococcus pneumoniae]MDS2999550.1 hypothetical protein [Streptococcus pneumoniae]MDS3540620.1 hypothetical protein [Streptococcus pneumoniae]